MKKEEIVLTEEQRAYYEELRKNPPQIIKNLPYQPGELLFTELSNKDKFQVLVRYLNDVATYEKNQVLLLAQLVNMQRYICEHLGIDVVAKEKEASKKMQQALEENIEKSKEEIEKLAK